MKYDTAGQPIYEPIQNCNCGLTGGCLKCVQYIPVTSELEKEQQKLDDWKRRFNKDFEDRHKKLFPPQRSK